MGTQQEGKSILKGEGFRGKREKNKDQKNLAERESRRLRKVMLLKKRGLYIRQGSEEN